MIECPYCHHEANYIGVTCECLNFQCQFGPQTWRGVLRIVSLEPIKLRVDGNKAPEVGMVLMHNDDVLGEVTEVNDEKIKVHVDKKSESDRAIGEIIFDKEEYLLFFKCGDYWGGALIPIPDIEVEGEKINIYGQTIDKVDLDALRKDKFIATNPCAKLVPKKSLSLSEIRRRQLGIYALASLPSSRITAHEAFKRSTDKFREELRKVNETMSKTAVNFGQLSKALERVPEECRED